MRRNAVRITNFFKNCGGSLPPLLIISLWLLSTYLLYPHQSQKAQVHVNSSKKLNKIKSSIAKIPSKKR